MKNLYTVKINMSFNCVSYALARIGIFESILEPLELEKTNLFVNVYSGFFHDSIRTDIEKGDIIIFHQDEHGFWSPDEITSEGIIISHYHEPPSHCVVYEGNNLISDISPDDNWWWKIRIRNFDSNFFGKKVTILRKI